MSRKVLMIVAGTGLLGLALAGPPAAEADSLFDAAIQYYSDGNYPAALIRFRRLIRALSEDHPILRGAYLMAMKSESRLGNFDEAENVGREFLQRFSAGGMRAEVLEEFAEAGYHQGRYRHAVECFLDAREIAELDSTRRRIDRRLAAWPEGALRSDAFEDLRTAEPNPSVRELLAILQARELAREGHRDGAGAVLPQNADRLLEEFLELYGSVRLRLVHPPVDEWAIGCILPLTGPSEERGRAFLLGAKRAIEAIRAVGGPAVSLVVEDYHGDPAEAAIAVLRLSGNNAVVAVIAPLVAPHAVATVAAACDETLPIVLPVATVSTLALACPNVLQLTPEPRLQGRAMADLAIRSLGLHSLATLSSSEGTCWEQAKGFSERVSDLGGKLVAEEFYAGSPHDLTSQLDAIRRAAGIPERDRNAPSDRPSTATLNGKEDSIDGIFVAAPRSDIAFVGPQLAREDFVGTVLGNGSWHTREVLNRSEFGAEIDRLFATADLSLPSEQLPAEFSEWLKRQKMTEEELRYAVCGYTTVEIIHGAGGSKPDRVAMSLRLRDGVTVKGRGRSFVPSENSAGLNGAVQIVERVGMGFRPFASVEGDSVVVYSSLAR